MICPNCGTNNEDNFQFCMNCGTSLSAGDSPATGKNSTDQPAGYSSTERPKVGPRRSKDLLKDKLTPADGEVSVRTYYCTYYLSRLLGLEAWGYLGITNKRVIFQALGTSNAGNSVIQSELPIADVSGISSYKGTYFSFGHIIAASFVSFLASIFTTFIITIVKFVVNLVSNNLDTTLPLGWLLAIVAFLLTFGFDRQSIWKPMVATISSAAFALAGGGSLLSSFSRSLFSSGQSQGGSLAGMGFFFSFLTIIYALFCILWYARRPTFSLAISSKGGSDTPISISGASGIGLFNVSADRALTAEPAEDAELMLEQLGAVILDIQMLGDMGISKWKTL